MRASPVELAAIVGVVSLLSGIAARIVANAVTLQDQLWILGALPVGVLSADFASGVFHWAGDTLGDADTPVVGPRFIAPFRDHHTNPLGITTHGVVATNGNTAIGVLPFLAAVWVGLPAPRGPGLFVATLVASGSALGSASNQFHKWAHAERVPRVVAWLQRAGIVLPPARHALHHTPPFDRHYCIAGGWLSAALDRVGFFRALERMVAAVRPDLLARPRAVRDRAA